MYTGINSLSLTYFTRIVLFQDFPVIFHGVAGSNERDKNSPSLYNMAEVWVLKEYLKSILDHLHKMGVTEIEQGEIGIITPYRKQVSTF